MFAFDWQSVAAAIVVGLAVVYLAWTIRRTVRSRSAGHGCGSACGSCPSKSSTPQLVQLNGPQPPRN